MQPLKAHVRNGCFVSDEPTDLPEGTEAKLFVEDAFADMDPAERAEVEAEIEEGFEDFVSVDTTGTPCPTAKRPGFEEDSDGESKCHVYFVVVERKQTVRVLLIWDGRRARPAAPAACLPRKRWAARAAAPRRDVLAAPLDDAESVRRSA